MDLTRRLLEAARWLKHAPDRWRHPRRRAELLRRITHEPLPGAVLFVCLGNICRSPYAAAVFEQALTPSLRQRIRASSGGFIGPGRGVPPAGLAVARRNGVDLSSHRSSVASAEQFREADLIVVMEIGQQKHICHHFGRDVRDVIVLGDLDPEPITRRTIRDPFDQPEEVFAASYERIERCVEELAGALAANRTPGAPGRRPRFQPVLPGSPEMGSEADR